MTVAAGLGAVVIIGVERRNTGDGDSAILRGRGGEGLLLFRDRHKRVMVMLLAHVGTVRTVAAVSPAQWGLMWTRR
jgi:hypothetical protein